MIINFKLMLHIMVFALYCGSMPAAVYYVDAVNGSDANSGLNSGAAWKSLPKVNSRTFSAGDSILFKCGSNWTGQLWPKGSGTTARNIYIGSYGTGARPCINGEGGVTNTLYLYNQEYWTVSGLEITNYLMNTTSIKRGIYIQAADRGTLHNITLCSLYVHDVNGDTSSSDGGGIFVEITGTSVPTNFDSLIIEKCSVLNCDKIGISNTSSWDTRTLSTNTNWYPSTNLIIRNNWIERSGGNGCIIRVAVSPVFEYNVLKQNSLKASGNAMFVFNCDDALIQYNESYLTVYNDGDTDASGFDADYRCKRTVIQFNYSHDNDGGFVVVVCWGGTTRFNDGTIIRYNISQNDHGSLIRVSGQTTNTNIYNNIIYSPASGSFDRVIWHKSWDAYPDRTNYYNNVFYFLTVPYYNLSLSTNNVFDYNVFFGQHAASEPADAHKLTSDPLFVSPGSGGVGIWTVEGYKLNSSSPCINSGVSIPGAVQDLWGNSVPDPSGIHDRGAYEFNSTPGTAGYIYEFNLNNTVSDDWSNAACWLPVRTLPRANDILRFTATGSKTINNVPPQTISCLQITGGSFITLQTLAPALLKMTGNTGKGLSLGSVDSLIINGANSITLKLSDGCGAEIYGKMLVKGSAHKLIGNSEGSVKFYSGGVFSTGTGFSSNPFDTLYYNSVEFESGSIYINNGGANPFGAAAPNSVVRFLPGSCYIHKISGAPSISGRAYANFICDNGSSVSYPNSGALTVDSLVIRSGNVAFGIKNVFTIQGSIIIYSGASLTLAPSTTGTVLFSGSKAQSISGSGALTSGAYQSFVLNNPFGLNLNHDLYIQGSLSIAAGILYLKTGSLTLSSSASISGSYTSAAMICADSAGELRKEFSAPGSFMFPVGSSRPLTSYAPATLTVNSGLFSTGAAIGVRVNNTRHEANLSKTNYLSRYWSVSQSSINNLVYSLACSYSDTDVFGSEDSLYAGRWDGSRWQKYVKLNTSSNVLSISGLTAAGAFTGGEQDYMGDYSIIRLSAIPEGTYNSSLNCLSQNDTVKIYLCKSLQPYAKIDSSSIVLNAADYTGDAKFKNAPDGTYYLVLKHRNCLETWSKNGGVNFTRSGVHYYDFTSAASQAYGANQKQKYGKYCLFSGDINQDGNIDYTDLLLLDSSLVKYSSGYSAADLNGDGIIDYSDLIFIDNNASSGIRVISPFTFSGAKKRIISESVGKN